MTFTSTFNFQPLGTRVQISALGGFNRFGAIVLTDNGNSVVFYHNDAAQIVGRTLSSGNVLGTPVVVSTTSAVSGFNFSSDPEAVSAARLINGNIVLVWADPNGNREVFARIFDANLNPVTGGIPISTRQSAFESSLAPDVAVLPNGDFVVAYQHQYSASDSDVRVARRSSTGADLGTVTVAVTPTLIEEFPAITALTDGGYAVAYQTRTSSNSTTARAAVFNGDNSVRVPSTIYASNTSVSRDVDVIARNDGGYTVAFRDNDRIVVSTTLTTPAAATGAFVGQPNPPSRSPVAALSPDGYAVAAWNVLATGNNLQVVAQLIGPNGSPLPITFVANAGVLAGGNNNDTVGNIVWLDRGTIAVAYDEFAGSVSVPAVARFTVARSSFGDASNDVMIFTDDAFRDEAFGGAGNDVISTGLGDDYLQGDAGSNTLSGGPGNDLYSATAFDTIIEQPGEGTDTVDTSTTVFTLGANLENIRYSGSSAALLNGNDLDNVINAFAEAAHQISGFGGNDRLTGGGTSTLLGGDGNDMLFGGNGNNRIEGGNGDDVGYGYTGNDTFYGGLGSDVFFGDDGNDIILGDDGDDALNGGAGANVIAGGEGNDVIFATAAGNEIYGGTGNDIFNVVSRGDTIIEFAGEGLDEVRTTAGIYVLANNIENLTLTDNAAHIAIFGNASDNIITGGTGYEGLVGDAGNDTIRGGAGAANELIGGTGNDLYVVEAGGDTIIEYVGEGIDTVSTALANYTLRPNVENLTYTGSNSFGGVGSDENNAITGGAAADTLVGLDGNDVLTGGSGADLLIGGNGADQFRYLGGETGFDRITDFTSGSDRIALSATGFVRTATVDFVSSGAPAATSTNSTFLYNGNSGMLSYDADGTGAGAAVALAQLNAGLTLAASDFIFNANGGAPAPVRTDAALRQNEDLGIWRYGADEHNAGDAMFAHRGGWSMPQMIGYMID